MATATSASKPKTTSKRKPAAPKGPAIVSHDMTAPPAAQAAQIALIVQQKLRVESWLDVHAWIAKNGDPRQKVVLTEYQQQILDDHASILPYISRRPKHLVIACPACGRYAVSATPSSAKCSLTLGCEGKLVSSKLSAQRS